MEIFEWIIWIILAVLTLTSFITWKIKERDYKKGSFYDTREVVALITVPRFVIAGSIVLIIFLFINISKFHLIWIYPGIYILILLRMGKRVVKADEKRNEMLFEDTLRYAQNGDASAQFALGDMYFFGKVVSVDLDEAKKWLIKAANQNHIDAQFKLSKMYLYEEDDKNALEWTQRAAAQGHPDAQHAMSVVYSGGVVIPQDFVQALMWCILSADQGHKEAAVDLDLIAKNMTPKQIEKAQNLAKKWKLKIKNMDNSNVPRVKEEIDVERSPKMDQRPMEIFLSQDEWLGKQIRNMSFREYIGMHLGRYSSKQMKEAYRKTLKAFSRKVRPAIENIIHDSVVITKELSFWDKDCETVFHTLIRDIESHVRLFEGEWSEYDKDMVYLRILEIFTLIVSLDLSDNKNMREDLGVEIITVK